MRTTHAMLRPGPGGHARAGRVPVRRGRGGAHWTADRGAGSQGLGGTGTLVPEGEEWRLQAGGKLYELHLGQFGHDGQTAAALRAGAQATVNGFISGDHISPITLETGGATLRFRAEDGRPLWGGMRLGPNAKGPSGDTPPAAGAGNGSVASGSGWSRNPR